MHFSISVVITTYNRTDLLMRAVNSVVVERSERSKIEIIVVDDASVTTIPDMAIDDLIYHRMPINSGPGPARMVGVALAHAPWVLMLDDDDILEPGAAEYLAMCLPDSKQSVYPVFQFSVCKTNQNEGFRLVTFEDYANNVIIGDFTPVFDRDKFLKTGLRYPSNRAGGEHLLWWRIASIFGIPSYNHPLIRVSDEAVTRLTHFSSQVVNAAAHQHLAEMTLEYFGARLQCNHPDEYRRIRLAHIAYSLLNNQRVTARLSLKNSPFSTKLKMVLWMISWQPNSVIKKLFIIYRQCKKNTGA